MLISAYYCLLANEPKVRGHDLVYHKHPYDRFAACVCDPVVVAAVVHVISFSFAVGQHVRTTMEVRVDPCDWSWNQGSFRMSTSGSSSAGGTSAQNDISLPESQCVPRSALASAVANFSETSYVENPEDS